MKYATVLSRHPSHRELRKKLKFPFKAVIRLGSTTEKKAHVHINTPLGVENSADKFLMKKLMIDAGIPTCKTFYLHNNQLYNMATAQKEEPEFPIVAKHRRGSRGSGNYLLKNIEEATAFITRKKNIDDFIFEEFYSGVREYRLHTSPLGCFCSWRKLRRKDQKVRWFFNSRNSVFVGPDNELFNKPDTWKEIEQASMACLEAVGLDIGAIDVRVNKKGEFKIIETNSAPSLGEQGRLLYLDHLYQLINHKYDANKHYSNS